MKAKSLLLISLLLCSLALPAQQKVSAYMVSKSLQQGNMIRSEAEVYFRFPEGDIVMKHVFPDQTVYMSNPLGEARIYNPDNNQVIIKSGEIFTSLNQNLYHFLTNQTYDLGLSALGFKEINSTQEDQYFVTRWQAPERLKAQVDVIKMVHENLLPVHADYINSSGTSALKVYFEKYQEVSGSVIPSLITEIIYLPGGDSVIKRIEYSDIRWGHAVNDSIFEFNIPKNAKVIK